MTKKCIAFRSSRFIYPVVYLTSLSDCFKNRKQKLYNQCIQNLNLEFLLQTGSFFQYSLFQKGVTSFILLLKPKPWESISLLSSFSYNIVYQVLLILPLKWQQKTISTYIGYHHPNPTIITFCLICPNSFTIIFPILLLLSSHPPTTKI